MMKKTGFETVGKVLLFLMVCCAMLFATNNVALAAPKTVSWKILKADIIVLKNTGEHEVRLHISVTNNSTNERKIVRLYDQKLTFNGVIVRTTTSNIWGEEKVSKSFNGKRTLTASDKNLDLFPGKSYNFYFTFSIPKMLGRNYIKKPYDSIKSVFYAAKNIKLQYDFKYATERI